MFENRTFENIIGEMLAEYPEGTDIRQGSIAYDYAAPVAMYLAKYYADLDTIIELVSLDNIAGELLDIKAKEFNSPRTPATKCVRYVTFMGAAVGAGKRFFADNIYFVTALNVNHEMVVTAEEAGETPNYLPTGTKLIPVDNIPGLTSAELGAVYAPGTEQEGDANLRNRIRAKYSKSAQNGNRLHYKQWCEEVAGVGLSRIQVLWNGPNTVRGILIDPNGLPVSQGISDNVQNYIDPESTGLGNGIANAGAYFTAAPAEAFVISVSFLAQIDITTDLEIVKLQFTDALVKHFKDITMENDTISDTLVRASAIANIIYDVPGVTDYADVLINGIAGNIPVPFTHVPVVGVVTIAQI